MARSQLAARPTCRSGRARTRARSGRASDEYERANGNTYREYELALPRELSRDAADRAGAAVCRAGARDDAAVSVGDPYADGERWEGAAARASDVLGPPARWDRAGAGAILQALQRQEPGAGRGRKFSYGADKEEAARTYEGIRERWAKVQNLALEHAGVEARVDHRSLAAQGIRTREPELHRGPAVSGIEARGEVSEVGERQREQRLERTQAREWWWPKCASSRARKWRLERVAVRERRELAQEVTGEDREVVLQRVEADRREQIERAQAAAERRVERRQGLGIGGRLLDQARALRERIGQQLGRVREWVRERFPDPLQQIKERSRDLMDTVVDKVRGSRTGEKDKAAKPSAGRSLDATERARVLKEARAVGRPGLERQVQAVREDQAVRQRLEALKGQERERQRVQRLERERQRELELEKAKALERSRGRGRGRGFER